MTSDSELPTAQEPDHGATPHEVQVEERRLTLHDFLRTLVK